MMNEAPHTIGDLPRRRLLRNGLVLGAAATVGTLASGAITNTAEAAVSGPQPNWAFCGLCTGLFDFTNIKFSRCPYYDDGRHGITTSYNYDLPYNDTNQESNPQSGWLWCGKCQGLFYGPGIRSSYCPAAGNHAEGGGSYDYALYHDNVTGGQSGWTWCYQCQGLFHGGSAQAGGVCPKTGFYHFGTGSFNYYLGFNGYLP